MVAPQQRDHVMHLPLKYIRDNTCTVSQPCKTLLYAALVNIPQLDSRTNLAAMKTPVQKIASLATLRLPLVTLPAMLLKAVLTTASTPQVTMELFPSILDSSQITVPWNPRQQHKAAK